MGYSHFYTQTRDLTLDEWQELTQRFNRMLANLPPHSESAGGYYADRPLVICGGYGHGSPEVKGHYLTFNGDGTGDEDLAHETFYLSRTGRGFHGCKTARKPYDFLVCAVLLTVNDIATGAVVFSSDGDRADWQPAYDFVQLLKLVKVTE